MKESKLNKTWVGAVLGIVCPIPVFIAIYLNYFSIDQFQEFWDIAFRYSVVISKILSLSLITNLALIFLFLRWGKERIAHGILFVTLLWGIPIVYYKLFE